MRLTTVFLSSTFRDLAAEREVVLKTLAERPDTNVWLPRCPERHEHPLEFYEEVSLGIITSDVALVLISSDRGSAYDFIDSERFSASELVQIVAREGTMDDVISNDRVENALIQNGESFTQVEARFWAESPPQHVRAFVDAQWVEELTRRREHYEQRGILFETDHTVTGECDGMGCWEAPPAFGDCCRVEYYVERQRSGWKEEPRCSPDDRYYALTADEWSEISWINFTCDVLRNPRFHVKEFESGSDLAEKVIWEIDDIRRTHLRLSVTQWISEVVVIFLVAFFLGLLLTRWLV